MSPPKLWATQIYKKFPFVPGMKPAREELNELVLNRTWRPALSVTGLEGAPPPSNAGNVLRPFTTAKLSLRLPPTVDADKAAERLKQILDSRSALRRQGELPR